MGSLRQDLRSAAVAALEEDLLRQVPLCREGERCAVVLSGSTVTPDADAYSGCDLIVYRDGAGPAEGAWHNVRRPPHFYRYRVQPLEALRAALARGEDEALYLARHGDVLHDPAGALRAVLDAAATGPELWRRKLAQQYRACRQRRASLAWALRRGQPMQVLDNLNRLLEHAMRCCHYLDSEPAPGRKWLLRSGLRTAAGRRLREPMLELFSALGGLATLGGSLQLQHNRLYLQAGALQRQLESVLQEAGLPVPGLASECGDGQDANGADGRAPRPRPGRSRPRG